MIVEFSLAISGLVLSPNKWLKNMPIRMYVVVVEVWTQGKRKIHRTDLLLTGVYKTCAWDHNGWTNIYFETFFKSTLALTRTLNKKSECLFLNNQTVGPIRGHDIQISFHKLTQQYNKQFDIKTMDTDSVVIVRKGGDFLTPFFSNAAQL